MFGTGTRPESHVLQEIPNGMSPFLNDVSYYSCCHSLGLISLPRNVFRAGVGHFAGLGIKAKIPLWATSRLLPCEEGETSLVVVRNQPFPVQ